MLSPLPATKPSLSTLLSDEDITVAGTLGENQQVSWMPRIKLWSCHHHNAQLQPARIATTSPSVPIPVPHQGEGVGDLVNEKWAALPQPMPGVRALQTLLCGCSHCWHRYSGTCSPCDPLSPGISLKHRLQVKLHSRCLPVLPVQNQWLLPRNRL